MALIPGGLPPKELGDLLRQARESGDPAYFDRAEVALKKSLQLHPEYADAIRHLAFVLLHEAAALRTSCRHAELAFRARA